jgi:hypothetical protein
MTPGLDTKRQSATECIREAYARFLVIVAACWCRQQRSFNAPQLVESAITRRFRSTLNGLPVARTTALLTSPPLLTLACLRAVHCFRAMLSTRPVTHEHNGNSASQ